MRQFRPIEPTPTPKKVEAKRPAHEQAGWPTKGEAAASRNHGAEQSSARAKQYDDDMPSFLDPPTKRRGPKPSGHAKELVSLRLSGDVLAKFRATGKGWQARINDALRKATP